MAKKTGLPGAFEAGRSRPAPPEPGRGRDLRRTRLAVGGAAAVAAVVVIVLVLVLVLGGGGSAGEALADAGCTNQRFPSQGRNQVSELPKGFAYNSFPATSGPHAAQPALWNIYEAPIDDLYVVGALERGGIAVQYGAKVSPATVSEIRRWYAGDRNGIIVAPLPALEDKVALTAWTRLATCPGFDEKAFDAFRDAYRGQGPVKIPVESLVPGA